MKKQLTCKRIMTFLMALIMVVGCVGLIPFQVNAYDYGTSVTVSNGSNSDIYAAVTRHSGSYYDWQEYGYTVKNNTDSAIKNITINVPVKSGSVSNFKCWGISAKYSSGKVVIKYSGTLQPGESFTCNDGQKFGFGGGALFDTPTVTVSEASESVDTVDGLKYKVAGATKDLAYSQTPVGKHGTLSVKKVSAYKAPTIVDKNGDPVQLRGASTHGVQWFPEYVNKDAFRSLRDEWGINTVRLALYAKEGGYTQGSQSLMDSKIEEAVSVAKELGMYVIIDWHVLSYNPNDTLSEARTFFKKYAAEYKNCSNVIFEICNEPTGTPWYDGSSNDLYTYCKTVAKDIRDCGADNIIICGTNDWSQRVDEVAQKPLKDDGFENIMYALHFYAATHYDNIKENYRKAIDAGTPIFVSEFGCCDASGNGGYDFDNADDWMNILTENNVSYACWSLCNKGEAASMLNSSCSKTSKWTADDLSEVGIWLVNTSCALAEKEGDSFVHADGSTTVIPSEPESTEEITTEEESTEEITTEEESTEEVTTEEESTVEQSSEEQSTVEQSSEEQSSEEQSSEEQSSEEQSSEEQPSDSGLSTYVTVYSEWDNGLVANISINNNSDDVASGWTVEFDYPDELTDVWCGEVVSHKGSHYVVCALDYNKDVYAHSSTSFGFVANKTAGKDCKITNVKVSN